MKKTILAGMITASLALAACSNSDDEVIVTSDYGDLTQGDFYDQIVGLAGTSLLEQVVMDKILNEKYKVTDDEIQEQFDNYKSQYGDEFATALSSNGYTEDTFKESLRFQILQQKALEDVKVSNDEIKAYYEKAKYQLSARHILVETEDEAKAVVERLNKGEDFATVAKEVSTDTASAEKGGTLDWFTVGDMVQPFTDAAYALEKNEISEPVQSDYGYHIIQLLDKKEVEDYGTLKEEKDSIVKAIKAEKAANTEWETVEAKLLKEANVKIKADDLKGAFGSLEKSDDADADSSK